tara:strand:+ start:1366 stop:1680 length:315 start_codon:yes stop_codon:yes gene_type:complete
MHLQIRSIKFGIDRLTPSWWQNEESGQPLHGEYVIELPHWWMHPFRWKDYRKQGPEHGNLSWAMNRWYLHVGPFWIQREWSQEEYSKRCKLWLNRNNDEYPEDE